MTTTSNILIENLENETEYSFSILLSTGIELDKYLVSVEHDDYFNTWTVRDYSPTPKRSKEFNDSFEANMYAIKMIKKHEKSVQW